MKLLLFWDYKLKQNHCIKEQAQFLNTKNCEIYGHTVCNLTAIGDQGVLNVHLAAICKIKKLNKAKCANCGELHPAIYRGCIIAKQLQKIREKILYNKERSIETSTIVQQLAKIEKTQLNFPTLSNDELPSQLSTSGDSSAKAAKSILCNGTFQPT